MKTKTNNYMKIFLFYTLLSLVSIIIVPVLGIVAPVFIVCALLTPILGIIKLFAYIFGMDIPLIIFEVGLFTLNPFLGFIVSILLGIILFLIGYYAWKLLLSYLRIVSEKRKKLKL